MKKLLLFCVAFIFVINLFAQALPNVKLENQKGELISIKDFVKNKPVVILCWSTTCKPCILELKNINEQLEEWREEVDFDIIAISIDDSRSCSKAKAMASGFGWNFTCLYDKNQDFKRAMNISLIPQSYIIDKKGNVVFSHTGYTIGSEQEIFDKLVELKEKGDK